MHGAAQELQRANSVELRTVPVSFSKGNYLETVTLRPQSPVFQPLRALQPELPGDVTLAAINGSSGSDLRLKAS